MTYQELVDTAIKAKQNSYSPYSKFRVGAALEAQDGKIYTGANIENASYGLSICAERTALLKAVSEGEKKFTALAVSCDTDTFDYAFPCGACRQVMAEFLDDETDILVSVNTGEFKVYKMKELLPNAFRL